MDLSSLTRPMVAKPSSYLSELGSEQKVAAPSRALSMKERERIRKRYEALAPLMDERLARLWAAAEAMSLGRGGTAAVAKATGISAKRILAGKRDLAEAQLSPPVRPPGARGIRRPGGGRKGLELRDPGLAGALEELIEGAPDSPLRWTCKSTRRLAEELTASGHPVGATKVRRVLAELGYSLLGSGKVRDGQWHPSHQLELVNRRVTLLRAARQPAIWVELRRKELGGYFVAPREHGGDGQAPSHGRLLRNAGWVNVGIDDDVAEFAIESVQRWWRRTGKAAFPGATELFLTSTADGSVPSRMRLWRRELQRFADGAGLTVHFSHYPSGTSRWTEVEHRTFCRITENRRGRPIERIETVIHVIGGDAPPHGPAPAHDVEERQREFANELGPREWNYRIEPARP